MNRMIDEQRRCEKLTDLFVVRCFEAIVLTKGIKPLKAPIKTRIWLKTLTLAQYIQ